MLSFFICLEGEYFQSSISSQGIIFVVLILKRRPTPSPDFSAERDTNHFQNEAFMHGSTALMNKDLHRGAAWKDEVVLRPGCLLLLVFFALKNFSP